MDKNLVILSGRVGQDPVYKEYTESDSQRLQLRVATGEEFVDNYGEVQTQVEWHNVVAWGHLAKHYSDKIKNRDRVFIVGSLRTHKWVGRDEVRHTDVTVVASEISCTPYLQLGEQ